MLRFVSPGDANIGKIVPWHCAKDAWSCIFVCKLVAAFGKVSNVRGAIHQAARQAPVGQDQRAVRHCGTEKLAGSRVC